MELRSLKYFLEIAREENMSKAAERLNVSQSALSRQVKLLEAQLGQQLFIRHSFSIELTEAGRLLRRRCEDIISMVRKTEDDFSTFESDIKGSISLGCAESDAMRKVSEVLCRFRLEHPSVRFDIKSGNTEDIKGDLDKGLLDFAVIAENADLSRYNFIPVESEDVWGAIMRKDDPLASKSFLTSIDLEDRPLILSRQAMDAEYAAFFGEKKDRLNVAATFNLPHNGALLASDGMGIMLCFDKLVDTGENSPLCFVPLHPVMKAQGNIIWKKYQVFSRAADALLGYLKKSFPSAGQFFPS